MTTGFWTAASADEAPTNWSSLDMAELVLGKKRAPEGFQRPEGFSPDGFLASRRNSVNCRAWRGLFSAAREGSKPGEASRVFGRTVVRPGWLAYLLSATPGDGVPKSRRLFAAVLAARALG
jgi:hypothetical protein